MPMPSPESVAELIRDTARQEILPRFRLLGREDVREKGPGDLVTVADIEAERRLTAELAAALPGSSVLGEEAAAADPTLLQQLTGDGPVWVIDPVDGTGNFARGREGFAVIVALVEAGGVRAGWLYDPLGDVMVTAVAGGGAWCGAMRLRLPARSDRNIVGAAYGRVAPGLRAAEALARDDRVRAVRNLGCSGLEYIAVARGEADFSLHSRSLPWDHAAGMLIVAEAGGLAGFLDGGAYDPRISDRPVLAASHRKAWDAVREVVGTMS